MLSVLIALSLAVSPHLEEARRHLDASDFARARAALELARASTLDAAERREVLSLLAYCWAAENDAEQVVLVFKELLAVDPLAPAPSNRKLRLSFQQAKAALYPPDFVKLSPEPARPGRVSVRLVDPWGRCTGGVHLVERGGDGRLRSRPITLDEAGRGGAEVGDSPAFVEARGATGPCAGLGSPEAPLHVGAPQSVPPPPPAPSRPRWVPWATLGVGTAAGVAAGLLFAAGDTTRTNALAQRFASDVRAGELQALGFFTAAWGTLVGAAIVLATSVVLFATW
ncbi:MAG: hypothetical protein SFW67_20900 [Myxococcaceae bacterium]|nr:hypothetical protein [Myxococcaceae bacterium]